MTDEQIVRALECCGEMKDCKKECPLGDVGGIDKCIHTLMLDALELIKRQQAEIEDLREIIFTDRTEAIKKLKAEAVKEFADKLKELSVYGTIREYSYANNMSYMLEDMVSEGIDILVKEMTEKEGGKG